MQFTYPSERLIEPNLEVEKIGLNILEIQKHKKSNITTTSPTPKQSVNNNIYFYSFGLANYCPIPATSQ